MQPIYIFDLDGCLQSSSGEPIAETVRLCQDLYRAGGRIWIWTGRMSNRAVETRAWIKDNVIDNFKLAMRDDPSFLKHNFEFKQELIQTILSDEDRENIICAFDNSSNTVKMYRKHGIMAFRVKEFK